MTGDSKEISDALDELFDIAEERATGGPKEITTPLFDELQECHERYCERKVIARGGMKCISRVFDIKSNRYVAMAKLHDNATEASYDQFIREARLTAMLEHPNIISVYDIGVEDTDPYFTMELKIGDSLEEILFKRRHDDDYLRRYSLENLLGIFLKICDAVSFAHSKNVVHLDLKPANIQVGEYGEVIVCDWGLGKVIGSKDVPSEDSGLFDPDMLNNITLTGEIKGTPGYMAPEQIVRGGKKTQLTDIYSLGGVLYSLLTNQQPLRGDSEMILRKTLDGAIEEPVKRCTDREVPTSLNAVVVKAMARDKEDRYGSVDELRTEVHNYLTGHSTAAENAGIIKELILVYKRNRAVCLSLLGSVAILIAVTGAFINGLNKSKNDAEFARDEAEQARDDAELARDNAELNLRRSEFDQKRYQEMLKSLKSEREVHRNLSLDTDGFRREMFSFIDASVYDEPKKVLDEQLESFNKQIRANPSNKELYLRRGFIRFVRQDMKGASEDFAVQCDDWFYKRMKEVSDTYAPKQTMKLLDVGVLCEVIESLRDNVGFHKVSILVMKYDGEVRKSLQAHSRVVRAVLRTMNPDWHDKVFEYDEESRSLVVGGGGLFRLGTYQLTEVVEKRVSFTKALKLKKLVAAGTDLVDLDYMDEPDLEEFDMRKTLVRYLWHVKDLPSMRRIIVSPNQIPENQIALARQRIGVIVK